MANDVNISKDALKRLRNETEDYLKLLHELPRNRSLSICITKFEDIYLRVFNDFKEKEIEQESK